MQNYIAIDLLSGTLKRNSNKNTYCFFIVNQIADMEFIQRTASDFLDQALCFTFWGKYASSYRKMFIEITNTTYPNRDKEKVPIIQHIDLNDFAQDINELLNLRAFVPFDTIVIYDDEKEYQNLKKILANMKNLRNV